MFYPPFFSSRRAFLCVLLAGLTAGCSLIRGDGSRARIDTPPDAPHRKVDATVRPMRLEVTTDATGQVVTITVVKSSGLDAIDAYVADSIRGSWPPKPSMRSLVELTYSAAREKRFSEPKVLSTVPVP